MSSIDSFSDEEAAGMELWDAAVDIFAFNHPDFPTHSHHSISQLVSKI
jgi:hypothetical protein